MEKDFLQCKFVRVREHVIRSTCDENVNQLTLGWGGLRPCNIAIAQNHPKDLFTFFYQVSTYVETDFLLFFLSRPCALKPLIRRRLGKQK